MFTLSVKLDADKRGCSLPDDLRDIAERLRAQAFELQRRFELAESTAALLEEMLNSDTGVESALDDTYEAHAFVRLRLQLFRILVVDISACVLDSSKSVGSVTAIVKELCKRPKALEAIKAYYADSDCLVATLENGVLSPDDAEYERARAIERSVESTLKSIEDQWATILSTQAAVLDGDASRRMKWARDKLVAHFEKSSIGLLPLDAQPPAGGDQLTWLEPVNFIYTARSLVYDTFALVTSTSWDAERVEISSFYARAFWDRLKNGKTALRYEWQGGRA